MKIFNTLHKVIVLALFVCFFAIPAFGKVISKKITASVPSPIPVAYSVSSGQSLVLSGLAEKSHVMIINDSLKRIAANLDSTELNVAPTSGVKEVYIPAGSAAVLDDVSVGDRIYIRSDETALTAGTVFIVTW